MEEIDSSHYMFNLRDSPRDPCKRPLVASDSGVWSNYTRHNTGDLSRAEAIKNLERVRVFSQKLEPNKEQAKVPRRQCCDISLTVNESMVINVRQCGIEKLISMHFWPFPDNGYSLNTITY